jgi:hypothetical protein
MRAPSAGPLLSSFPVGKKQPTEAEVTSWKSKVTACPKTRFLRTENPAERVGEQCLVYRLALEIAFKKANFARTCMYLTVCSMYCAVLFGAEVSTKPVL